MTASRVARLAVVPIALALFAACDDTTFLNGAAGGGGGGAGGWCGVTSIFDTSCLSCHSAASKLGGLDLETDPYNALLNGTSAYPGKTLVVPGDPANSFLVAKIEGTQSATEGSPMPLGAPLPQASLDLVRQWITDGATDVCTGGTTGDTGPAFQCDDKNEQCDHPGQAGCGGEGGTMLPGADCLQCHVTVGAEANKKTVGGTVYLDLGGSAPVSGAKVHITDTSGGNEIILTSNAVGNFYSEAAIPSPYNAWVEVGANRIDMLAAQTTGACNSCHNCSGAAGGKMFGP